jgi:hypothetical protein
MATRSGPVVVLVSLLVSAMAAMAVPEAPPMDTQSKATLERMCTFLASVKAFTVHADISAEETLQSGVKVQRLAASDVQVQRPNKLQATITGDLADRAFWYDGESFAVLLPARKLYALVNAPATLDACMDWVIAKTGLAFPLLDYVYSDPLPGLVKGVRLTHYLGSSKVDGVDCIHLAFKQSAIDWQVWVEDSVTPVPRRVVVTYKSEPGAPQYVAVLSGWTFPKALPAEAFRFVPPEGASQMQFLQRSGEVR